MERFYRFADFIFRISGKMEDFSKNEGVLEPFRVDGDAFDHSMDFEIVSSLPKPEGKEVFASGHRRVFQNGDEQLSYVGSVSQSLDGSYMQICRKGNRSRILVQRKSVPCGITHRLVLNAMETEHQIIQRSGFLIHASFIRWKDRAILFTAPSGTGKSTQAELWHRLRNAEVANGDRVAVTLEADGIIAWGIPFCGTSGICKNTRLPVAAIVYLTQAPVTTIQKMNGLQAFRCVWEGCSVNVWNQDDVDICIGLVMSVVEQIPVYHMACTPDETAVEALEKMLERGEKQDV
jgi:hypothetical protein